jgi:hypothetical protein
MLTGEDASRGPDENLLGERHEPAEGPGKHPTEQ